MSKMYFSGPQQNLPQWFNPFNASNWGRFFTYWFALLVTVAVFYLIFYFVGDLLTNLYSSGNVWNMVLGFVISLLVLFIHSFCTLNAYEYMRGCHIKHEVFQNTETS